MKNTSRIIHMVSHTHWDREWYFTTLDSQVLAMKSFTEMIEALEANPDFVYHLDAQSSLALDYLAMKPEMTERFKALVAAKRLLVGPWYTQPDLFNIGTESMFRNLRIGIHHARALGNCMDVLYLPDTFGSHAQVPQLARAFGLNNILIRRGYNPDTMGPIEMRWQAANGDVVKTVVMPFGYMLGHPERGARYRNFDADHFRVETFPLLERMKQMSASEHLLCPVGGDQVACDADFDKLVEAVGAIGPDVYINSSYEAFLAKISEAALPFFCGEFRSPRLARVHKSIGSSRYDIKQANSEAELYLTMVAEPLAALALLNGLYVPTEMLEKAWRLLLESHAHDSMGGCNSDVANRDVLQRCRSALQIGEAVYNMCAKLLLGNYSGAESYSFLVNNGTGNERVDVRGRVLVTPVKEFAIYSNNESLNYVLREQTKVPKPRHVLLTPDGEVETFSEDCYYVNVIDINDVAVPPLGVGLFHVCGCQQSEQAAQPQVLERQQIENEYYRLYFEADNVTVVRKCDGALIPNFIQVSDMANDGDLYDFSPLKDDRELVVDRFRFVAAKQFGAVSELELAALAYLPAKINDERTERVAETLPVQIGVRVILDGVAIRLHLVVDNTVLEHRMQLVLETGGVIDSVQAGMPFGLIERYNQNVIEWDMYTEKPVDVEPFEGVLSAARDFHVFSDALKEYEYCGSQLRLTLFRGSGFLGKDDLLYRPGRASGQVMPAPEGNLLGALEFEVAFCWQELTPQALFGLRQRLSFNGGVYQLQEECRQLHRLDNFDMFVPQISLQYTALLGNLPPGLVFSGVDVLFGKLIIRFFNPGPDAVVIPATYQPRVCNAIGEALTADAVPAMGHVNFLLDAEMAGWYND